MKYFVYFLMSLQNGDIYVGSTADWKRRISLHNSGKVKSTRAYRPWKLLGFEEYGSRSEAFKQEKFYKTGQQKEILKDKFANL